MSPEISVIIPVYNDTENLKKCLESIYDTSFNGFEVIVVDDGSEKNVSAITGAFPVKLIRLNENKGQSFARNRGVDMAHGEIIVFTDADCVAMKDWVQEMAKELQRSYRESDNTVCVCGRLESGKGFFEMCHAYTGYGYIQGGERRFMKYLNTACVAVFKNVFREVGGFSEDMRVSEDFDIALRLAEKGYRIVFEPRISVFHNHGIKNIGDFLKKQKNWGEGVGFHLTLKHKGSHPILSRILFNPVSNLISITPLSLATAIAITWHNVAREKKVLILLPFIFLGKLCFRWGIFIRSCKDRIMHRASLFKVVR